LAESASGQLASPEAVSYLGIEKTKTLVLVAQAFSGMEGAKSSPFSIERLWRHSMSTGKLAQWIARDETGDARMADETFTAGVLHDVGKLMLAANLPEEYNAIYKRAQEKQISLEVAEREAFGTTHAEIGACLLGAWGLPFSVVEAIAFHHNPAQHPMKDFGPVTAVHVANVLDHEMQPDPEEKLPRKIDADYLARLNRENLPAHWRQVCLAEQ
jgi:putative nucleotidyltransferase with HDIG domain